MNSELSGFINIDKPVDWSSHDVVAKLRRLLDTRRIGHAGTLDPFATGVLPIAVGSATRLIRFLKKSKKYYAEMDLSKLTDTDDCTGEVIKLNDFSITEDDLKTKLTAMIGYLDQLPPLYSAKKINGKKLYELMREGKEPEASAVKTKKVFIQDIRMLSFNYPYAEIEVSCGEGTYIRAIARDCGGHLTKLRRLESNGFGLESSVRFEDLEDGELFAKDFILRVEDYLNMPKITFENKEVVYLQQGRKIVLEAYQEEIIKNYLASKSCEPYLVCLDKDKELIGLAYINKMSSEIFEIHPKVIL
jgi:tRNA pseudouridine55 synthase